MTRDTEGLPSQSDDTVNVVPDSLAGTMVGPYRLLEPIGEGGFGTVYAAEQTEPVRRRVAVKIIKAGMDTKSVIARFDAERQALALMDHPNIAKALDAGSTDEGRPYFVMELVRGIPITDYCDRHRVPTRARLALFMAVCRAVQHAHQKGVIHRDIKPSNVLVAMLDGEPTPKVIDFGIAKATAAHLTDKTLFTQQHQLIGTPEYMSPEQAEMTGLDIDTRTDIYSLGVLLYELLTSTTPFNPDSLRRAGIAEICRLIREIEPPRPSTRLHDLESGVMTTAEEPTKIHVSTDATTIARYRGTDPTHLERELRGDLDWIVMKAMEKDRARRYESPSEMAADVERYLHDQPVLAGPPSARYRLRKFIRRHRVAVSFAAVLGLVLIAFGATMAVQAARISRERDRANLAATQAAEEATTSRQVVDFLVGLFEVSDPGESRGETLTAREILDRGAEQIEALEDEPAIQATMLETIGRVYLALGEYHGARPLLEDALAIRDQHADDDPAAVAKALHSLANLYTVTGAFEQGEQAAERAIAIWETIPGEKGNLAHSLNSLGNARQNQGRLEDAEEAHRRALVIREELYDGPHMDLAQSLHNIGIIRYFQADYEEAAELYQRAIEIEETIDGPDSYHLATSIHTLSIVYKDQHRWDKALEAELHALDIRERVLGEDHAHVALSAAVLSEIYRGLERYDEAVAPARRAVVIGEQAWSPKHPELWWMKRMLARALIDNGEHVEAEQLCLDLIAMIEAEDAESSLPLNLNTLGNLYRRTQRLDEAEAVLLRSIAIAESGEESASALGLALAELAAVLRDQQRPDEAEAQYQRALSVMEEAWGPRDPDRLETMREYAGLLREAGRETEARGLEAEADGAS